MEITFDQFSFIIIGFCECDFDSDWGATFGEGTVWEATVGAADLEDLQALTCWGPQTGRL